MAPPPQMDQSEKLRLRTAAYRAQRVLPSAVAEMVSRELRAWEEYGWRLGNNSLVMSVVNEILKAPEIPLVYDDGFKTAVGYE